MVKIMASEYIMNEGTLYKRGIFTPLLRCLTKEEAGYTLQEVHEGIGEQHLGAYTLSKKNLRASYFWLNTVQDARKYVKKCFQCQ